MAGRREILNAYDFIDEWRMEPCLWNDRAEGYRDKPARESALRRLSEKFNMNDCDVKAKITNLRCYYGKELAKQRESEGNDDIYVSKWPYFTSLEFLRDHITHRRPGLSVDFGTQNHTNNEDAHGEDAGTAADDGEQQTETPLLKQSKRNSNTDLDRRRMKKAKTKEGELLDLVNGLLRRQAHADKRDEDADDVFGRHIAHELRNITDPRAKQLAKLKIQNILFEVQFGSWPVTSPQDEQSSIN